LTLGTLLAGLFEDRRLKIFCLAVAAIFTLLVELSRVCLDVHYLTDVLAGWLASVTWAMLCFLAFGWRQLRGKRLERSLHRF